MATERPGLLLSFPAEADLSTHQFKFVDLVAAGVNFTASAGAPAIGVLQDKPDAAGRHGSVMVNGESKVIAGEAVAVGDLIMTDTTGRAATQTGAATHVLGVCTKAAANADEICSVLLFVGGNEANA